MSDSDDRSGSGHGSSRGRSAGGRWLALAGWILAAVLLVHFLWSNVLGDGAGVRPAVPREVLLALAYWVPVAALLAACAAGLTWAWRAYRRREKGSVLWMRNGFLSGVGGALVLTIATFDERHFPRPWLAAVSAVVLAVVLWVFAYATYREERRSTGMHSHRSPSNLPPGAEKRP